MKANTHKSNPFLWLWNSPTFTTWGNYATQSLRLLVVTPLILTRFDETQIAAFYLFATLNFLGLVVSQRVGLTFSRMLAFSMSGASYLGPIKNDRTRSSGGEPNWNAFERAYGTMSTINLIIGSASVILAIGLAYFGLNNLLSDYPNTTEIWFAFWIFQASWFVRIAYQHYLVALIGINCIALVNRWRTILGVVSCLSGIVCLLAGGSLIALVIAMQIFLALEVLLGRFLLGTVESGRIRKFKVFQFDREMFRWCWEPTWKGFIGQFGMTGGMQLIAIAYTGMATKGEVASYLFALRLMQTITQFAHAPISSIAPKMSKLLAAGNIQELRSIVCKRGGISLVLLSSGIISVGISLPTLFDLLNANLTFVPQVTWWLLGLLTLIMQFNSICITVNAIGNEIVFYWHAAGASILGLIAIQFITNDLSYYGPIICSILPLIILLNTGPYKKARATLSILPSNRSNEAAIIK